MASELRFLRFAEAYQRLRRSLPQEVFTELDVRTVLTLLSNHGLVMPFDFGDLVLLQPHLLNSYAAAVIRAARSHIDEIGCVGESEILDGGIDFEGVERLERSDEELLLRAMIQTFLDKALCLAEETEGGRLLVFPSQYRRERAIQSYPDVYVSYTFSGQLTTVFTTLVVRLWYTREFERKELWRDAAELVTTKGHTAGLLMKKVGDGVGTISVFFDPQVPDELRVVLIDYVHRHLLRYARDVTRERRYVCRCGKQVTDQAEVAERLAIGKDFILCQRCDQRVLLADHIEQRLSSDPVAREVLRMDEAATYEIDNQAREQILIGHMSAIVGEANQIFRPVTSFDFGIDGEVEFKKDDGTASGRRIYVQLKSGDSYLRARERSGDLVFDVRKQRHLKYWVNQPADVYLVIRDGDGLIQWMNVTAYLKSQPDLESRQIPFKGEKLDAAAVWRVRDRCLLGRLRG